MRLRETLVIYMFPLMVLPTLAFGYLAYRYSESSFAQQAFIKVAQHLQIQQNKLNVYLRNHQMHLQHLSQTETTLAFLSEQPNAEKSLATQLKHYQRHLQ